MSKKVSYTVKLNPETISSIKKIATGRNIKPSVFIRSVLEDTVLAIEDPQGFAEKLRAQTQENLRKLRELNINK